MPRDDYDHEEHDLLKLRKARLRLKRPQDIRLFGYIPEFDRYKLNKKDRAGPNSIYPALRYPDEERRFILDDEISAEREWGDLGLTSSDDESEVDYEMDTAAFPDTIGADRIAFLRRRLRVAARAAVKAGRVATRLKNPVIKEIQGRTVSQYWFEKFYLLLDWLQIYALLWLLFQDTWPHWWVRWTEFILYINLDLIGFRHQYEFLKIFDAFGIDFLYFFYVLIYALWPVVLLIVYSALRRVYWRRIKRSPVVSVIKVKKAQAMSLRIFIMIAELSYLPVMLALFSSLHLDETSATCNLAVDDRVPCWGWQHILSLFVFLIIGLPFVIILPVWYRRLVKREVVFHTTHKHEQFLQTREIEYLLGINSTWIHRHFALFSSFRRHAVHYRGVKMCQKIILSFVYVITFKETGAKSWGIRVRVYTALATSIVLLIFSIYRRPFRNKSTLVDSYVLNGTHLCNILMACLIAEDVQNAITVSPTSITVLIVINMIGMGLFVLMPIFCCFQRKGTRWPITRHTVRMVTRSDDDYELLEVVQNSLAELDRAKRQYHSVPEMVDLRPLEENIKLIRVYWEKAESVSHLLSITLQDILEDLAQIFSDAALVSMLPYPPFERIADDFARRLRHRDMDLLLSGSVRKRILLKMYAVAVFMNLARPKDKEVAVNAKKFVTSPSFLKLLGRQPSTKAMARLGVKSPPPKPRDSTSSKGPFELRSMSLRSTGGGMDAGLHNAHDYDSDAPPAAVPRPGLLDHIPFGALSGTDDEKGDDVDSLLGDINLMPQSPGPNTQDDTKSLITF